MHATATEPNAPPSSSRRFRWRLLIYVGAAALLAWPAWEIGCVLFAGNVHEVIPGKLYRGAQPSAKKLEALVQQYKIRTVLNVRGCCWPDAWYIAEAAACERLGVNLEDVCFSAVHLPSRHELRLLIDVLDRAETPIFVHCRHGSDRTGIAAMVAELLLDDKSYDDAQRQLSMRYGHIPIGKTTMLDRFMQLYADWLAQTQQTHAPARLRHWILNEYRGGWCDAHFEKVERLFDVPRVGKSLEYNVVVRNTSTTAWQFRPLKTAGYHITYKVINETQNVIDEGRAGMLDALVQPGEKIQVVLIVAPIAAKGNYRLQVDMIEEGHCWFHQTGSELWEEELAIRE
ncbi:MAG: tyrosine-protein phosphatase [Planctomycetes bacterium]|nr:tyrosine-protein phosphatase [Planctomycetota bacterium]